MAKASTIKALYKCLLRDAREIQRTPQFRLRNALKVEQWGHGHYVHPRTSHAPSQGDDGGDNEPVRIRSLQAFYEAQERGFRYEDHFESVPEIVRQCFKAYAAETDRSAIASKLDDAILALQEVSTQLNLAQCSSVTKTHGIRIEATSQYVPSFSSPAQHLFRFTYRVNITNENADATVQITGRQLTFMSERGQRTVLPRHSPGIVGNTPVLQPGQSFEYASGVDIDAPRGSVTGCLHTVRRGAYAFGNEPPSTSNEEDAFDAFISKFQLVAPGIESER